MKPEFTKRLRRLNITWHRDLGYFFSSLIIIYCISGIALNHINDWNPDFIVSREHIKLPRAMNREQITKEVVLKLSELVREKEYKLYDFPTNDKVKIYYEDASLQIDLASGKGEYEKLTRRPLFYESNVLHRNSLKGWKWASDIFAFLLILISITGLFILRGRYGFWRRGIWFMLAGFLLPLAAIFIFHFN